MKQRSGSGMLVSRHPDATGMVATAALAYPRSAAEYAEAMAVAREGQRASLAALSAASPLTRMQIVDAGNMAAGGDVLDLGSLKNRMKGGTIASAERAAALAAAFGCRAEDVAPHLAAMPWASGRFVGRFAGRAWSDISTEFGRISPAPVHDVPPEVSLVDAPSDAVVAEDDVMSGEHVLMQMAWLGGSRMRFVYRGLLSPVRAALLKDVLSDAEPGGTTSFVEDEDVLRTTCDVVVPLSSSSRLMRAIAGSRPVRRPWWSRLFRSASTG